MRISKELFRKIVWIVAFVNNTNNSRVNDHLGACVAWLTGHVHGATLASDSHHGSLEERVLFCVKRTNAMTCPEASQGPIILIAIFRTMRKPPWSTVVARRKNSLVAND
jgi:hypothetical protein